MKIRSSEDLTDRLAQDLIWRKRELSDLKYLITSAYSHRRVSVLGRSGIALLYAHWEGYIKKSSEFYLEFIRMQRLKNKDLANNFLAIAVNQQFHKVTNTSKYSSYINIVDFFKTKLNDRSIFSHKTVIDTESNLTSKVFKEIISTLGFDYSYYEPLEKLIDSKILGRRNKIAHGETQPIDVSEYLLLHDRIIEMLENYRTLIENAVVLKQYLGYGKDS
ncbi:MAG: hypothetical protein KKD44_13145 [Proteobacteria bacterium]|nr:hypothetical protein [Pseudomonadota bacterium]